jgi:chaperonin cofactor prefoldin
VRAELTHLSTRLLKLEREQEIQFKRIAQIQHELDEIRRVLEKIGGKS